MEEMLLRVCVIMVASLLYIKDHSVFQEQEEKIITDMQEWEYLLHKEVAKLEQEVHQVATGPPHSNEEVSQSHRSLTNGEGESSDVRQVLPNGKVDNPHAHQMPSREDQDIQDDAVPLDQDNTPSALEHGGVVDENFPLEKEVQLEIGRASYNNVQEDDISGHVKEVPHNDRETKTLNEDQIEEVQGHLNGVNDSDQKSSRLDQVGGMSNQISDKKKTGEITEENPTGSSQQSTWNTNNLWKFLSLISFVRFLGKVISKGLLPTKNKMTTSRSTGIVSKIFIPDHKVLSCFYDQCVQVPPSTCDRVCEFAEGFADELLEAAREACNEETDMQIGDFIGVGSLYELWAIDKTTVCDLYVPITAPRLHGFEVELQKKKDAPLLGFGRIKIVKAENTSNGCSCSDGNPDDDTLCLLHPHSEVSKVMIDAVGGPLCQENTPYLSKKQVVNWFRTMIMKAWGEISHKYELELGIRSQVAPGALRVRFRSGKIVLFNITPVVQVKGSKVYLVSHLSANQNLTDIHWPISFASYENALLQYFNKILPYNSCHVKCLQILAFLHKQQSQLTGRCGLTSYHLKSALLHLLVRKPTGWHHDQLTSRLMDMLTFLDQRLQAKEFHHALIGNSFIPNDIGLPKEFQMAKPTNIFLPMALDEELYSKTVHHFQELVKNAPLLIQEYGSMKSSGLQWK